MMQFQLCENTGFFLRVGLVGPSGSGKTYTALAIATALGYERIGVLDTENRSARRYARTFPRRFQSLELSHFSPRDYIEAIHAAEAAGIEVLIIDSLSHAWMGRGGVLEMVDQSARRQSRGGSQGNFNGWREVTPEHNRLVDALVQAKLHLIVTMRVKTEYVVEKSDGGKSVPRKIGLAPVQRDGLEYEFDVVGDLSPEHDLAITKSRCPAIADLVVARPGAELAESLRAWLDGAAVEASDGEDAAEAEVAEAEAAEGTGATQRAQTPLHDEAFSPAAQATLTATPAATAAATVDRPRAPALPRVRAVAPRPRGEGAVPAETAEDISSISPWLHRIKLAEVHGSEEQLDAVRSEMNATLKRRTRAQGEALRRAIETARAAIHAGAMARGQGASTEAAAQSAPSTDQDAAQVG